MIGERLNMEDVFFRDLTLGVLDTLEGEIKWINKFTQGDRVVNVPFYYSMTGDERFLLDSFSDDIVSSENRYVELNTDVIPRGHLTLSSYEIRSDEFANPNVWLKVVVERDSEIRKMLAKVKAIPITAKYQLSILLSSEIDTFKCSQAIMDTLWLYRFFYFEYNFMNIDAVILIPDSSEIELTREKNLSSDNNIKLTLSFEVHTYYPAYRKPKYPDSIPYQVQTDYNSRTIGLLVQISQKTCSNIIFQEAHTITTDSKGVVIIPIGSGSHTTGNFLSLNSQLGALKISILIDSNNQNNYSPLINCVNFDHSIFSSDPNCNNNTWSNAYDYVSPQGEYKDIIIFPKRTKWYNNFKLIRDGKK